MKIVKLESCHKKEIKSLFHSNKWMGILAEDNFVPGDFNSIYYDVFCDSYLSGLQNYHAFAAFDDSGNAKSLISFYESNDNPDWYWTHIRSDNDRSYVPPLLDTVIEYNENNNRFKFYSMWNARYQKIYRRFAFSKYNSERYDSFEEYHVPAKTRCVYNIPWLVLYGRTLVPVDTIVRCTFLKQQYRDKLVSAGNI